MKNRHLGGEKSERVGVFPRVSRGDTVSGAPRVLGLSIARPGKIFGPLRLSEWRRYVLVHAPHKHTHTTQTQSEPEGERGRKANDRLHREERRRDGVKRRRGKLRINGRGPNREKEEGPWDREKGLEEGDAVQLARSRLTFSPGCL